MSLYFGIGNNFSPDNIPNMAALMYLCIAQPAWGAVSYIPAIMLGERHTPGVHLGMFVCLRACLPWCCYDWCCYATGVFTVDWLSQSLP